MIEAGEAVREATDSAKMAYQKYNDASDLIEKRKDIELTVELIEKGISETDIDTLNERLGKRITGKVMRERCDGAAEHYP